MKINSKMSRLLCNATVDRPLDPSLKALLRSGFSRLGDCELLTGLLTRIQNAVPKDFSDAVGFECFVNSIHVEDYDQDEPLSQAIVFVLELFKIWDEIKSHQILIAIISADEDSVVVRFHLNRPDQQWLNDDLEKYLDAILQVDSSNDLTAIKNTVCCKH
ncbi:hypothetical protein [Rhizobium rhizogenes]|uniref:hypothetical protein n=1 Tax=Rhizobium rhizogenes TaxID=359 RepID=UPI0022CB90B7|nr:hypothetical protein [Rhizobium rhizogenes]MCZ7462798.1 hypothetical protein [Rhizobium rhizogenes]